MLYKEITHNNNKSCVSFFETPESYADFIEENVPKCLFKDYFSDIGSGNSSDTYKYGTYKDAIDGLRHGSEQYIAEAHKIIEQLTIEGIFSTGLPMPSRAISGSLAIKPLFDAGVPNCMITRDMSSMRGVNAPLNVYWDRFSSIGFSSEKIIKRGIAISAFVMAMNSLRPVNLYMISCSCPNDARHGDKGLYGGVIRVESRPLDLARATWMFCNPAFSRPLTWTSAGHHFYKSNNYSNHPFMQGPLCLRYNPSNVRYESEFRAILEMETDDILLYGSILHDRLFDTDVVQWVRTMIEKHRDKTDSE